jgi:2-polyprenyl-3-methyl-5-hydroxy-6-metoxy-1,4-benzoquinol methylase
MNKPTFEYDGERLVPNKRQLKNLLTEDLSKFHFASQYATGSIILDAGCGAGQGTNYLAQQEGKYVVGVDIASEALTYAHDTYTALNLTFGQMDVSRLGFQDSAFDMVTSIEVIEHLPEPEKYVTEICRVLKIDGTLVLSTPNKLISSPTPGSMWPHHIHEFYPDELSTLLERYFPTVELWGMCIPVYEKHPIRWLVHQLAPIFKPILPLKIRTRFLPMLQSKIKPDLALQDISISRQEIAQKPTLIAVCHT